MIQSNRKIIDEIEKVYRPGPAIIYVESGIAVIGEACTEARFISELPNRIRLLATYSSYPSGTKLHRHAAEILLPNSSSYTIGRFKNNKVLNAVLGQNFRSRYTFNSNTKTTNQNHWKPLVALETRGMRKKKSTVEETHQRLQHRLR